ncbi:hypothetical protein DFH27DRAFT_297510 [Peziza echinospora]|nr:hypothetical protein DFH27DRAFT_297510 [Peziza echinospora]
MSSAYTFAILPLPPRHSLDPLHKHSGTPRHHLLILRFHINLGRKGFHSFGPFHTLSIRCSANCSLRFTVICRCSVSRSTHPQSVPARSRTHTASYRPCTHKHRSAGFPSYLNKAAEAARKLFPDSFPHRRTQSLSLSRSLSRPLAPLSPTHSFSSGPVCSVCEARLRDTHTHTSSKVERASRKASKPSLILSFSKRVVVENIPLQR